MPQTRAEYRLEGAEIFAPQGCMRCGGTGYHGRVGVYEVMSVNEEIRSLVIHRAGVDEIAAAALAAGMQRMRDDALSKVRGGITSLAEATRVTTARLSARVRAPGRGRVPCSGREGTMRLGVIGWPVAHSRSPAMQNAALRAVGLGESWHYGLLPVAPAMFEEVVRGLPAAGFRGANVTIPHKAAALALASEATARARAIGAANTLVFEPDGILADNTDAPALIAALPFPVRGRTALVLGAGGSARAAVWALLDAGAAEVRVWNRTAGARSRAGRGARSGGGRPGRNRRICSSTARPPGCSPRIERSSSCRCPPMISDRYDCVVDFVYSDTETELARCARSLATPVVDGLELLVGQGALSFERFTGLDAPVDAMRAAVRQQ